MALVIAMAAAPPAIVYQRKYQGVELRLISVLVLLLGSLKSPLRVSS